MADEKIEIRFGKKPAAPTAPPLNKTPLSQQPPAEEPAAMPEPASNVEPTVQLAPPSLSAVPSAHAPGETFHPTSDVPSATAADPAPPLPVQDHTAPLELSPPETAAADSNQWELETPKRHSFIKGVFRFLLYLILLILIGIAITLGVIYFLKV